jgi:hypothetical protein
VVFQAQGTTRFDATAGDNRETPTAWIEFDTAQVFVPGDGTAHIFRFVGDK